jgi:hypothetical protein
MYISTSREIYIQSLVVSMYLSKTQRQIDKGALHPSVYIGFSGFGVQRQNSQNPRKHWELLDRGTKTKRPKKASKAEKARKMPLHHETGGSRSSEIEIIRSV